MTEPIETVLALLDGVRRNGAGWCARCPAHEDHTPSMTIAEGEDGRVLLHCHAGCELDAILAALELAPADLFIPKPKGVVAVLSYAYTDEQGSVLYRKIRKAGKRFHFEPNLEGRRRVIYRLHEVRQAIDAGRWVVIVEGEKDADRLAREGITATTLSAGAESPWLVEYEEQFARARQVVIIPDNDGAGRKYGNKVANGLPVTPRWLELEDLPDKGDVCDWFDKGHGVDELKRLIRAAPEWAPVAVLDVDGAKLLDRVADYIKRYVVLRLHQLVAVTLWIAHTHGIAAFYTSGRLFLRSPEPECGKSLLFDVMEPLVPADPILDVSVSPAALYRSLDEQRPPVVMLDEIDKTIGRRGAADSESLALVLAVVNGGYRRGRSVRRCVGKDHKVVKFPIFAPTAFAGISPALDRAVLTRSIPIEMQRRAPDEYVHEYVAWDAVPAGEELRDELGAWIETQLPALKAARPDRPAEIRDRLAECWVPLFAVADAAGGDWPRAARAAALEIHGFAKADDDQGDPTGLSLGARLLYAIKAAFGGDEAVWTSDLLDRLNADDEAPWASWNDGEGINARDLANRLRGFGVHRSADLKLDGTTRKGYRATWFADAWLRYLPSGALPRYSPTPATDSEVADDFREALPLPLQALPHNGSSGVAAKTPEGAHVSPDEDEPSIEWMRRELGADVVAELEGVPE